MTAVTKTYLEGYTAHRDGKRMKDNPHVPKTKEHGWWVCGWKQHEADEVVFRKRPRRNVTACDVT